MPQRTAVAAVLAILFVIACAQLQRERAPSSSEPILATLREDKPACLGMVQDFCSTLYAPLYQGKLDIELPSETLQIRRGKTENDFSQIYFEYAQTQIRHRDYLPRAFRQVLNELGYFKKLRQYLSRKPASLMTLEDRIEILRLSADIDGTWASAVNETVLRRMEKQFPGFSQMSDDITPLELRNEQKRMRNVLNSEIAKAFWSEHPNWKRVEEQFNETKTVFKQVIAENPGLSPDVKQEWQRRIAEVKLIVPGSDPEVEMIACSRTEENAYYYKYKNYVTVCAGDFNGEELRQVLAHELGHALDIQRSLAILEDNSTLGKELTRLRRASCSNKPFSCEAWNNLKERFTDLVRDIEQFQVDVPQFYQCLKGKKTRQAPTDYVERVAREEVQKLVARFAEQNTFLRLVSPRLPLANGKFQKNPMYLNPCGYYLWDMDYHSFDDELTTLLFFSAEYRCSSDMPEGQKFQTAIEKAVEMQRILTTASIKREGEFSNRERLNADGYAASPDERFADAMGQWVFNRMLQNESNIEKRRALYLANVAWMCPKPSLQQLFPDYAHIKRNYYVDPHPDDFLRQKQLLSGSTPDILGCKKDFEIDSCSLVPSDAPDSRTPPHVALHLKWQ